MRAWMNGRLLDDPTAPAVQISDHGFTVGDGVFEAIKVVDGQPFALTRHLERLDGRPSGAACPSSTTTTYAAASRRSSTGSTSRSAGCGSPTPAGPLPSARAAATQPPTLVVAVAPLGRWAETTSA